MNEPFAGDRLVSSRDYYTHHGLYIGNGQVIHYAGFANDWKPGKVEQIDLAGFEAGQGSYIRKYKSRAFTPERSIVRAHRRIGENYYCVLSNNCEHFVVWCITGDHDSFQVVRAASGANILVASVGGVGAIVGVAEVGVVAGLSGSGIMSGLASIGGVVGGGAVAGIGVAAALPAVASIYVMNKTVLKDNPGLSTEERGARGVGRIATGVGAASGAAGGVLAIGAMGTVAGFSGAGIASGLAAIGSVTGAGAALSAIGVGGGMMIGGVAVAVAAPALLAATVGFGAYKGVKWLRAAGWLPGSAVKPPEPAPLLLRAQFTVMLGPAIPSLPGPQAPRPDP